MGLTNEILFEYGRDADGNISIVGDTPTVQIHDADQNLFMQQRGMQDQLMIQIREEIEMPANGLSALWYGADEVKILENIAGLENPDHVMLALQVAPSLDPGTQAMLDTFGKGTPEFRQSLHAALQNPEFRAKLLSQEGAGQLTALLEEGVPEIQGVSTEVMQTATTSMATRVLDGIATGDIAISDLDAEVQAQGVEPGTTVVVPKIAVIAQEILQEEVVSASVDEYIAENPGLAEISDTLKAYPEVVVAIQSAAAADPTVTPGIETMIAGEGGLAVGDLKTMLEDPAQRATFIQVMHAVETSPDVDFGHAVTLAEQVKNNDFAGAKASLDFMGVDSAALGNSQMMGMLDQFLQSSIGQSILQFIEPILNAMGIEGGINGMMAEMGINFRAGANADRDGVTADQTPNGTTTTTFDLARLGISPEVTPDQAANVASYDAETARLQASEGGLTVEQKAAIGGYAAPSV